MISAHTPLIAYFRAVLYNSLILISIYIIILSLRSKYHPLHCESAAIAKREPTPRFAGGEKLSGGFARAPLLSTVSLSPSHPAGRDRKGLPLFHQSVSRGGGGRDTDCCRGCQIAKFDSFLSLHCAGVEGVGVQSKERKGSNFAA